MLVRQYYKEINDKLDELIQLNKKAIVGTAEHPKEEV